ncbi:MAG: hypothetical protein F6K48_14250 [Okeania sp. SIO3H1]|uniref:hypothetical protein n=1 Tax=Okeania sp. SIO1I7 TaxID=2607772 RepID=UPI0013C5E306|nr:hypothetical protein [Okeania sp. SIO1I7]NEN90007.1 hypothetical protein [Okeania sp. SIO3H1]NET24978.1 hypothetical protein [Okeania sp. SIO1I7]
MPGLIRIENLDILINILSDIRDSAKTNGLPPEISVKELKEAGTPIPILKSGTAELELFYAEENLTKEFPAELQPTATPSVNSFAYQQINPSMNLYYITGEYVANGVQQVPEATLTQYNSDNGTDYGQTEIREYFRIPLQRRPGQDVTLDSTTLNLWTNSDNGSTIDWLNPLKTISLGDTDAIKLQYNEDDNRYPVIFGSNLTRDINYRFSGIIEATVIEQMSEP